jgi:hypothetical protein
MLQVDRVPGSRSLPVAAAYAALAEEAGCFGGGGMLKSVKIKSFAMIRILQPPTFSLGP